MIEINTNPTQRELRVFGILLCLFVVVLASLLFWRWELRGLAMAVSAAGTLLLLVYATFPASRRLVYVGWMTAAYPIGVVVSFGLLAAIYYGVLTPIGLLRRWMLGDPLTRQGDVAAKSYWVDRAESADNERYFHQY